MSLFVIGDLHLHFQVPLKARSQLTDPAWKDHETLFRKWCSLLIHPEDTLVLLGDHSFGRKLSECEEDLRYIEALPGRKILLRGNHDMFWEVKQTEKLNRMFEGRLLFLQNNCYFYKDYALVGTKGYAFEGPFLVNHKGHIVDWDKKKQAESERLVERESQRLRQSFEAAKAHGYRKFIMFLHYPPTNILQKSSPFTWMALEYGAEQVIYAHCHGEQHFHQSLQGKKDGIEYRLVSGDHLHWKPLKILD